MVSTGNILFMALLSFLFLMWFSLVVWVWNDVRERTDDSVFHIIALILAFFGNIFGVAVYLVIRPKETFKEAYFTKLEEKIIIAQAKQLGVIDATRMVSFNPTKADIESLNTSKKVREIITVDEPKSSKPSRKSKAKKA